MEKFSTLIKTIRQLVVRLDVLDKKMDSKVSGHPLSEVWYDIQETCEILSVSKRTLQAYRDHGILGFSQFGGKIYFKSDDIVAHLNRNYNKAFRDRR